MYRSRDLVQTLNAKDYIDGYRDVERIQGYCSRCNNFGKCWACPPFDRDFDFGKFENVSIFVRQIFFEGELIPKEKTDEIILPIRRDIEQQLRNYEAQTNGMAFAFVGKCLYCPDGQCTRSEGLPCKHPELMRPSLEAAGFDVAKTVKELFGLNILWSKNGYLPEYYLIVSGLFHNGDLKADANYSNLQVNGLIL